MAVSTRILVLVAPLTLLLVIPGPFFGFDVPKAMLVTILAALGAPYAVAALRTDRAGYGAAARVLLAAVVAFVVTTIVAALASGLWPVTMLGQDGRFVGTAVLVATALLIAVVPAGLRGPGDVDRLLQVLAVTVALFCGYIVVQRAGLDPGPWAETWGRLPVGTVGNPNFVGAIAALGAPLATGFLLQRDPRVRGAGVALGALTVFSLWAASSRLGLAAAVAGVGAVAVAALPLQARTAAAQRVAVAAVPLGAIVAGHAAIALGVLLDDRNAVARWWFWRSGLRMWQDAPLLGVGPGRFGAYDPATRSPERIAAIQHETVADSSHAFLVDLLATVGLVGLLPMLVLLVAAGLLLRTQHLQADAHGDRTRVAVVTGLLAAHGVQAATSVPTVGSVWVGGLLLGLVLVPLSGPALRTRDEAVRRWRRRQGGRGSRQQDTTPRAGLPTVLVTVALVVAVGVPAVQVLTNTSQLAEAEAMLRAERPDLARGVGMAAVERTPWWPFAWRQLAQTEIALNNAAGVSLAAQEGLRREPRDLPLTRVLANLNRDLGNDAAVEEVYERVLELDPYGVATNIEVARWALETGRTDLARDAVARLEEAVPDGMRQAGRVAELRAEVDAVG